jgi:3-oxoacyl-[acyl-carrier protein] reductase
LKTDRNILIAGSSHGIGRELAHHYAENGHSVAGFSRGESDLVHERYRHFRADVADAAQVQQVFSQLLETPPNVLIYCAGSKSNSFALLMSVKAAEEMLRTSILGAFITTRSAVRVMKRHGFGRVIYLSSVVVPLGEAGSVIYGAGKSGLEQMAFSLSREFAKDNITFNALGLSIYRSGMTQAMSEAVLENTRSALVKQTDMELDELVGAIDFFTSDAARQITGQTLYFGGAR